MNVLIVDDERNIRESIQRLFALEGIESSTASEGREAATLLLESSFDALVLDLKMPGMGGQDLLEWIRDEGIRVPVVMISALGEIADAVKALKSGASDYLIKPFDPAELIHKVKASVSNQRRRDQIEAGSRTAAGGLRLVGESAALRTLRLMIEKIAVTDATVLVTGESGSGKEVVARQIHALSRRSQESFVAVNIGGIHEQLMESELFGHEKGAFTGADARKPGLFELAGAGTLFLDEIGEMPLPLQVKLLRVLQERKIRRLGGTHDIPVEARIISATNRNIEELVAGGGFRDDLYYRLNVVRLSVPPLRDRAQDIPLLAGHLLERLRVRMGKSPASLTSAAADALVAYPFPGNIRELENILERAMIYCENGEIQVSDLDLRQTSSSDRRAESPVRPSVQSGNRPDGDSRPESLSDVERNAIARILNKWGGNRTKAAAELGISRRTILYKIKRYGL